MGWLSGWAYRRPITVTNNTASALTNYQVLVIIDTQTLISQGKMRSDGGDIRFTGSDGVTLIDYWVESGINTTSTRIWVEVPSIPASGSTTIYIYYGNPSATSLSNGEATFLFFDTIPDLSKWTNRNLSGHTISLDTTLGNPAPSLKYYINTGAWQVGAYVTGLIVTDFAVEFDWRWDGGAYGEVCVAFRQASDFVNGYAIEPSKYNNTLRIQKVTPSGLNALASVSYVPPSNTWVHYDIRVYGSSISVVSPASVSATDTTYTSGYFGVSGRDYGLNAWFDNFRIRKYVSPEPTVSIGGEQTPILVSLTDITISDDYFDLVARQKR
jgi:hypothetical protein